MLGPLGFYEIIFILALGFLMLGPRQMALFSRTLGGVMGKLYRATADARRMFEEERRKLEAEMSDVTAPVREAKDHLKSIEGDLRKSVSKVEEDVRETKSSVQRQIDASKQDWSRRRFLGDADDVTEPESSPHPPAPEIKSPTGQMARGGMGAADDDPADNDAADDDATEAPDDAQIDGTADDGLMDDSTTENKPSTEDPKAS